MHLSGGIYPFMSRSETAGRVAALRGLGLDPMSVASGLLTALGKGGSSGGSAGGGGSTTVSPAIQTTISPQISPVFQQQFQPSNSPISAGTSQVAPTTQSASTGQPEAGQATAYPNYAAPASTPATLPNYGGTSMPLYSQTTPNYTPWLIGAGLIVAGVLIMKRKKKKGKTHA